MDTESSTVVLHIYDLSQGMAKALSMPLLGKQIDGVWHTAIVVYGREYFFGGGIQSARPSSTAYGKPIEIVQMGTTHIPLDLMTDFLRDLEPRFNMNTYSLLSNNCNNFSEELAQFLTGSSIPAHITGLPADVLETPLGAMLGPMLSQFESQMRSGGNPFQPGVPTPSASSPPVGVPPFPVQESAAPSTAPGVQPSAPSGPAQGAPAGLGGGFDPLRAGSRVPSAQPTSAKPTAASPGSTATENVTLPRANTKPSLPPSSPSPESIARNDLQAQVKAEFTKIMAEGGWDANEAAAEALRRVTCKAAPR
ncbi:hypothetical protein CYMTET_12246 [Cymbomonas tetramitiformis]|uniref:PPPDE domain-containing protein n=1 Tax=Cymbomonas tetramitiformis TaxID=36881 RepID=A0AAE0LC93_9CHLO|nr:hypothetical protein CYMTET_12246 [Cymbomonas tetramitiformis]